MRFVIRKITFNQKSWICLYLEVVDTDEMLVIKESMESILSV